MLVSQYFTSVIVNILHFTSVIVNILLKLKCGSICSRRDLCIQTTNQFKNFWSIILHFWKHKTHIHRRHLYDNTAGKTKESVVWTVNLQGATYWSGECINKHIISRTESDRNKCFQQRKEEEWALTESSRSPGSCAKLFWSFMSQRAPSV